MKEILVTGGAGYIGSHVVKSLVRRGYGVVVVDNLSRGHEWAVQGNELWRLDLVGDSALLQARMRERRFAAVVHLAALAYVGESMADPLLYYRNNIVGTLRLLDAMTAAGVDCIVFSSSCSVYGDRGGRRIDETVPPAPINPYARSKLACEWAIRDAGFRHGILRYFNAAGADPEGGLGELHIPETHLIPCVLEALRRQDVVKVFGTDYPTEDGTCIRDYVHVADLAEAHVMMLERLLEGGEGGVYNLGSEKGYSVLEVVRTCAEITGREPRIEFCPRREGDPAVLVADATKAKRDLGWAPLLSDLPTIVRTAWSWMLSRPWERDSIDGP